MSFSFVRQLSYKASTSSSEVIDALGQVVYDPALARDVWFEHSTKVFSASSADLTDLTVNMQDTVVSVGHHFGTHHKHNVSAAACHCDPSPFYVFEHDKVRRQIDLLASNKGVGLDDIEAEVLKAGRDESTVFLTFFLNQNR